MSSSRFLNALRTSSSISWKPTGKLQQTLVSDIVRSGTGLHSGTSSTAKLFPAMAGEGRFFVCGDQRLRIPASIDFVTETYLCTTLCRDGARVRTVEHLLSALEAYGVDNCRIEIVGGDEVPLLDGSAREWVEAIEQVGLCVAKDYNGNSVEKLEPFLNEPVHVWRNDTFIAAFPSPKVHITYGINFPQVPAIGCQWFSCVPMEDDSFYVKEIASSRTFCIYEEDLKTKKTIDGGREVDGLYLFDRAPASTVIQTSSSPFQWHCRLSHPSSVVLCNLILVGRLRNAGLVQGGSAENAIVCSASKGWLNPPLRFQDEPCRHKVLDLVGDLSLLAQNGSQGLPVAHIISYKGGHSLHAEFTRQLSGSSSKGDGQPVLV